MVLCKELIIDSVQCRFKDRNVLNAVYLKCEVGEIVGILGRNGSGKSILLKIIFGIEYGQFKHLTIDGKIIKRGFLTGQISYLSQHRFLPPDTKVVFAIQMLTNTYREELLQNDQVKMYLQSKIKDLSSGAARFIETLLILYSDSAFVLLDEPFVFLEPTRKTLLFEEIKKFRSRKGIIITDHQYREIVEVSDRIVLIHNGSNYDIKQEADLTTYGYLPH